jgi:hypothetical protein
LNEEEGKPVTEQSETRGRYGCTTRVVYTVSRQYVKEGLERVLNRKKRESPPVPAKATGDIEAKIIAASCSEPPAGYSRRTLRLPEERSKAVTGIELSDSTIRPVLKKNTPETAAFVANREDALEVYHRPYNERRPVIRRDEQPVQLLGENWRLGQRYIRIK